MAGTVTEPIGGGKDGETGSDLVSPDVAVLVLGIGNILLSDEGVGVRAVERFVARYRPPPGVGVVDGGTAGMGLIDVIAGCRHLIVVDAVANRQPPGTLIRLTDTELRAFLRQRLSPHQLALPDVLGFLELMDAAPRTVTILGAEPKSLAQGLDLSPELAEAPDRLAVMIAEELIRLGHAVAPRDGGPPPASAGAAVAAADPPATADPSA